MRPVPPYSLIIAHSQVLFQYATSQDVGDAFFDELASVPTFDLNSYYDSDADLGVLTNKKIVFLG